VKRFILLLLSALFLLSGPAWAWADCSRHSHSDVDGDHHSIHELNHAGHAQHDDSAPQFHCPPLRFDSDAIASGVASFRPQLRHDKLHPASHLYLSTQQALLSIESHFINSAGKFPPYPFLTGVSSHLLLSVFRI
jgi:hypothetical protein